jgi:hypothetical protein
VRQWWEREHGSEWMNFVCNAVAVYESGQCVCFGDGRRREPSVPMSVCCRCYRSDVSEDSIHGETNHSHYFTLPVLDQYQVNQLIQNPLYFCLLLVRQDALSILCVNVCICDENAKFFSLEHQH